MSIDSSTYILQTYGPEYRVSRIDEVGNLYGVWNEETETWEGNPSLISSTFGSSPIFEELEEAWDFALALDGGFEYNEYGANLISQFSGIKYSELIGTEDNGTQVST